MAAKKNDINLFRAAGGGRTKGKKKPITFYLTWVIVGVLLICVGLVVYFYLDVRNAKTTLEEMQALQKNYETTQRVTTDLAGGYKAIENEIKQAELIESAIKAASSRYPAATEAEINALREVLLNTAPLSLTYSYTILTADEAGNFESPDYTALKDAVPLDATDNSAKNTYSQWIAVLNALETAQLDSFDPVWYTYYRGQMAIIFEGGDGVSLDALCRGLYSGWTYSGIYYSPFSQIYLDDPATLYEDNKGISMTIEDTTYNIVLMSMKSVEERVIDALDAKVEALATSYAAAYDADSFRYNIKSMSYSPGVFTFNLELFNTTKMAVNYVNLVEYLNALDSTGFFKVDNHVVYNNTESKEYVEYEITLNIANAKKLG